MITYGGRITSLFSNDFQIEGQLYLSADTTYSHTLTITTDKTGISSSTVASMYIYLVNSQTGFKYSMDITNKNFTNNSYTFNTSPETTELANTDSIEIGFNFTNKDILVIRKIITPKLVKTVYKTLQYSLGVNGIYNPNLLYKRIKLGFPQWGSIEKNDISNGVKLLEPLFTPFYDAYNKIINYNINSKFRIPYKKYELVSMQSDPSVVFNNTTKKQVFQTSCLQSFPQKIETTSTTGNSELSKLLIYPLSDLTQFDLNPFLNTRIYIKKLRFTETDNSVVIIKGLDINKEVVVERITIVDEFYVPVINKFSKITDIDNLDTSIVLSNYVDCRYDHFIVKDVKTIAPIVDDQLFAYQPRISKASNIEGTRDCINIYSTYKELSEYQQKFDIEYSGTNLTSMYIDEYLRIYWTDNIKLYSGSLNIDLSKNVGNNPSANNNRVIQVNDINTSLDDWVEATVNLSEWDQNTSMIIQVKNKNDVLYYDQDLDSFTPNVKYYYPGDNLDLKFSVRVVNDSPYIFTVFNDTFEKSYSAYTQTNVIKNINNDFSTSGKTLVLHNDKVKLSTIGTQSKVISNPDGRLILLIEKTNTPVLEWELVVGGYSVTSTGGTLPIDMYTIISDGNINEPVLIELNRMELLKMFNSASLNIDLNLRSDKYFNRLGNSSCVITLIDKYGTSIGSTPIINSDDSYTKVSINFDNVTKRVII